MDGTGKLWLPDLRQAEREAGFPFHVLPFSFPYNGDKGGTKSYSFSACGACTSSCVMFSITIIRKLKSNWSERPPHLLESLWSKPQVIPGFRDAQRGDTCTVLPGDCAGTTPWKTQDPKNHCKFRKPHYWWVCKRLKPVFTEMCSTVYTLSDMNQLSSVVSYVQLPLSSWEWQNWIWWLYIGYYVSQSPRGRWPLKGSLTSLRKLTMSMLERRGNDFKGPQAERTWLTDGRVWWEWRTGQTHGHIQLM